MIVGVVVITDGIVGLPEASLFESLMTQLRHNTIACSFIPVSPGFSVATGLGQVPYPELLQFLATATFGAYFGQTQLSVVSRNLELETKPQMIQKYLEIYKYPLQYINTMYVVVCDFGSMNQNQKNIYSTSKHVQLHTKQ